jgi:CoA-binding domain
MSTPSQSIQSSLIGRQPSIQATFTGGSKGTLPFECVGWIAVAVDFVAIMATSVITDFAYRRLFLYPTENDLRFIGIGLLIFANFSAILAARGNYEPRNLLNVRRQIPEIISAWIVVSLILLGAVFSFKIAESFSRVSTTTALVGGCGVIVLWRIALRNWLVRALHAGRLPNVE